MILGNNNNIVESGNMEVDYVIKRDGRKEEMEFDKILKRIKVLSDNLKVNPSRVTQKVCSMIYPDINTYELDELASQVCSSIATEHPDYGVLASRIIISNHHKNTSPSFTETIEKLYNAGLINDSLKNMVELHGAKLNDVINYDRDYLIDYFGFKTLERSYLMRIKGKILERPQHLFMRVALSVNMDDLRGALETYDLCSRKYYTHATPTLYNAGTKRQQLSSCFLLAMKEDSIDGIYSSLKDCAMISKWAGGIGIHIHNIRAKNSHIQGTNGISNGIVPMLRVFNNTARYVDQCLSPETTIYTTNGPMKIKDVIVGESEVYNLLGETETIENVLEHLYSGDLLHIKSKHSIDDLKVTPEHPIYTIKVDKLNNGEFSYNKIINQLDLGLLKPDWVDAGKLTNNHFVGYPIPKYEKDISNISEEDCFMYGLILGRGTISNKNQEDVLAIKIESSNSEEIINKAKLYFDSKFINTRINRCDKYVSLLWKKNVAMPFKYSDIYDIKQDKYCNSRWLNLPIDKSKQILKGLLSINSNNINRHNCDEIICTLDNYNLIETIRFLCLKLGILTSGSYNKTNNKYTIQIPKTNIVAELLNIEIIDKSAEKLDYFVYNNVIYSPVNNISKSVYSGSLFDLQMPRQHNYLVHNGLVHNGGGKRNGSIAIYLEPWHRDIMDFLLLRKNHGNEEDRARDLFYAIWMPDLFMERVESDGDWTLFCPNECPGLSDLVGEEFKNKYESYEASNMGTKIKARELWFSILESQIETGTPYICYKDASNMKSNQQNLGTIKSSNLCTEIIEYSSKDESAVCNLASIGLSKFVEYDSDNNPFFNYDKLHGVTKIVTKNLDKVIDINFYPIPETKRSNTLHRPIGIGVQGLADVFALLKIPFDSTEAGLVNERIFETIYHGALEQSMETSKKRHYLIEKIKSLQKIIDNKQAVFAEKRNMILDEIDILKTSLNLIEEEINRESHYGSYSSFIGSPLSKGLFQFDLWKQTHLDNYNWESLRDDIKKYGVRNSLLVAPMPTASTSQILGNNECIEPFTSNIYLRRTLAGEFIVVNKYLIRDLIELNLWNEDLKNNIIKNNGSIQQIESIPQNIKDVYKTVWEIGNKTLIDMAATRGKYICQSQSLNLFMDKPSFPKLSSMHFYSWRKGLKTGIYYLRTKPVAQAQKFTIEPEKKNKDNESNKNTSKNTDNLVLACSRDNPDCEACGS